MRLLLAGASGFIGRHLVERLRDDHEVYAMSRTSLGDPSHGEVCRWEATEPLDLVTLPSQVDVVCYLATSRLHRQGWDGANDLVAVNVDGVVPLLEWARKIGVRQFIYASTGSVYGDGRADEALRAVPTDFYGASKLAGETLVASYEQCFEVFIPRLYTPYGPGQQDRLVPGLVDRVASGRAVELHAGSGFTVNPTYIDDVVGVFRGAIEDGWSGITNVAGPEAITLRDLAVEIGAVVGREPHFVSAPPAAARPADQRPQRTRLIELVGTGFAWTDLRNGLRTMWQSRSTS